ncbi:hypothetical protein CTI12_AA199270 [Artemisia annua]|uniref:Uncharacterized protein n=1 Tax=Artemisia annua TaxID=35608 RepID=A0A2U1P3L8_ARTAN|nr:hypothetical protein CTI12_AA199270 [Artemisia annua]
MLSFCTQSIPAEFLPGLKELDEVNILANGVNYHSYVRHIQRRGLNVYALLGDPWNTLVEAVGLEAGKTCVLTKDRGNSLWFDGFNDDGSMITEVVFKGAATLMKKQPKPDFFEERK